MKIGVTSKAFANNPLLVSKLKETFPAYKLNLTGKLLNEVQFIDFIADCDGVILAMEELSSSVIDESKHIRAIAKFGVGTNNINFDACESAGITVYLSDGVNKGSVAEMVVGFTLMLLRNLFVTSSLLSQGKWYKNGGVSLYGKTFGIIGFGHIGTELARLLQPFNCKILVVDIVEKNVECSSLGAIQVSPEELLKNSDVISIHTPLSSLTKGFIDEGFFESMKSDAILINTARGEIVDLNALKYALLNKVIGGAAIDVYPEEPPTDLSLLGLPNLIPTPHIGGNSAEATIAMGEAAIVALAGHFNVEVING